MKMPGFNAESSLYRTSGRYHMVYFFGQANGAIHPADTCFDRCMDACIKAGLDSDVPIAILRNECKPPCLIKCGTLPPPPPPCPPETERCGRFCCPPNTCCYGSGCCQSGETCILGSGCCPAVKACGDRCCGQNEVCLSPGVCCPLCGNRCCAPGESCTGDGCCLNTNITTDNRCCPNVVCNGQCCGLREPCCGAISPRRQRGCCEKDYTCCGLGCCPPGTWCNKWGDRYICSSGPIFP